MQIWWYPPFRSVFVKIYSSAQVIHNIIHPRLYNKILCWLDIAQVVGVLSQFMANPGWVHWDVVKWVFRYLRGTLDYSICYHGNSFGAPHLVCIRGFVDSNWASDVDRRRSTSGYVFTMFGGAISWMSKWQPMVAFSTREAKYMASTCICMFMRPLQHT